MADNNINLSQIQNILGYSFKDEALLKTAFTHASRAVYGEETNERLLFLGRRLFDVLVCDYIFSRSPYSKEAELEAQLDSYRKGKLCDNYLNDRNLGKYVLVSEISNVHGNNITVQREVFFAILGAIYRDGGMPSLKGFLLPMLRSSDGESVHASNTFSKRDRYTPETQSEPEGKHYQPKATVREKPAAQPKKSYEPEPPKEKEEPIIADRKPSFIRDALAPVRLPDSMRTQPKRKDQKVKKAPDTPVSDAASDEENYKSKLQELVQKNIRSANVLLKYKSYFTKDGSFRTEITLEDKLLAVSEGETKRESERAAAKLAYEAIMDISSDIYRDFRSLCQGDISLPERKEDYISKLNQYYQRTEHESSAPLTYERRYSTEKKTFCVALLHNDEEIASATGPTLKDARQNAAKKALEMLGLI